MVLPRESAETDASPAGLRRRGEVLQRAIFDAALDQLSAVGWKRLTMEGVAACAQTGKAALYRRWASKQDLVMAALEGTLPIAGGTPDLGSLREDLVDLLERMLSIMYSPAGCAFRAIMEEIEHEHARAFLSLIQNKVVGPGRQIYIDVLRRGIERGEVRADADVELIADVGPALMLYRTKMSGAEITPDYPERVVDQILMPMLRP